MINLYPHQVKVLDETKGLSRCAFFMDMGLGKTFTGSEHAVEIGKDILIICQKSKVKDWIEHFKKQYGFNEVYDLTQKKDMEHFLFNIGKYRMIAVINYELAWRRPELLKLQDFTLMLDESSLIQNRKTKQSKFILKLNPSAVILLSGTPVGGKYENLWTQLHLLGWNISEDLYNRQYVNWETIEVGGFIHKVVSKDEPYKNIDRLKKKMREHGAVFMKTEEVMDLPEQVFTNVMVDTSKEYWKFFRNRYIKLNPITELVGDTSLTKLLYCRQLCGQYCMDKLEAFKDLIQSTNDRVVVFYNFNMELEKLKEFCDICGKPVSEVNGHSKDLTAYEEESNSVTLVQYRAGAKGLNLQKANRIIYFTLPLSSEDFEQSKKRIHRIGQKKTCFYYIMMCEGSVEEDILHTLEERRDYTDELFRED